MTTITKTEAKWIITALNTHIEECTDLMLNPAIGGLTRVLLHHQAENYRTLRIKLERMLAMDAKQIRII